MSKKAWLKTWSQTCMRRLRKEYASRPEVWAFSYRLGMKVHHNMHLEALHRKLKHVHMNGRKVWRLHNCINALPRLMRSKMCDRLLKVHHKEKWTRHMYGIRSRHHRFDAQLSSKFNRTQCTLSEETTTRTPHFLAKEVPYSDCTPHVCAICGWFSKALTLSKCCPTT